MKVFSFFALILMSFQAFASNPSHDGGGRTESGAKIISTFQEGMALTQLDGRFGFVNQFGFETVRARYDKAQFFVNGYAAVSKNNRWTFINKQGQQLFNMRYEAVGNFNEEGVAPVKLNGKWGFINEQGQEFIAPKFERVHSFIQGKALVRYQGEWYYVNGKGQTEIAFQATALETALAVQK